MAACCGGSLSLPSSLAAITTGEAAKVGAHSLHGLVDGHTVETLLQAHWLTRLHVMPKQEMAYKHMPCWSVGDQEAIAQRQ